MWQLGESSAGARRPGCVGAAVRAAGRQQQPRALQARPSSTRSTSARRCCPTGPERAALFRQAQRIAVAYMPYKIHVHRIHTDLAYPWVIGFRRPLFWRRVVAHGRRGSGAATQARVIDGRRRMNEAAVRAARAALACAASGGRRRAQGAAPGVHARPRRASIRRASSTCTRATSPRTSSSRRSPRTTWRGRSSCRLLTAESMPEISADYRVWTVQIRPGIYFADDPAFKGQQRELVAADYVYALKRVVDPKNKSPVSAGILESKFIGLAALRDDARQGQQAVRLRQADRRPARARPLHAARRAGRAAPAFRLTASRRPTCSARVAREVVEYYGDQIDGAPGGHRPVQAEELAPQLARSCWSATPRYRERCYEAEPAPDDAAGQAIARQAQGPAPADDRRGARGDHRAEPADVAVVPERRGRRAGHQRRARAAGLPRAGHARRQARALPGQARHPGHAQPQRRLRAWPYFNMEDPVVGGYTPEKVALRRAISLAYDVDVEIRHDPARRHSRAVAGGAAHDGLRPHVQERDGRLRPGACAGAARPVRLRRPRRGWLARAARWQAADDRDGEPAR